MEKTVRRPSHCSCCVQRKSNPPAFSHYSSITPEKANYIARIDADVLRNHNAIIMLLNQQAALNRQRNTFMPAINLPPEILTAIFQFACCPDDDWIVTLNPNTCASPYVVTPLFIGSICSAWRSVAWGTPQLWNSIALIYRDFIDEKLAEMLDYWLSNSGELPLTVKLIEPYDSDSIGESSAVIEVIGQYANRLHTLELFLPRSWELALVRIASCTPLLTRLTLRILDGTWEENCNIEVDDMFADAAHLREVTLFGYNTKNAFFPWHQLESLESGFDDPSELVSILRRCPLLRRFAVRLTNTPPWTVPSSVMGLARHAAVEALQVFGYDETLHPELFRMLDLPALRSFVLHLKTTPRKWSSWLPPFLSQVAGTLETLHLPYAALSDEDLLTILRAVPRLRELVLLRQPRYVRRPTDDEEYRLSQRALDLLNPTKYEGLEREGTGQLDGQGARDGAGTARPDERGNGHSLVPNLETFEFRGTVATTSHALVEFLVARWRGRSTPSCGTSDLDLDGSHRKLEWPRTQPIREPLPLNLHASSARARLRSAKFYIPRHDFQFEDADAAVVQELRLEGMNIEFVRWVMDVVIGILRSSE
ncbi:hypothetical protein BJ912DRAFT_1140670 [Pholiota molesta]|nr:hypothetical protein BJ912DRAFT_1140670 [Pholiota molesta]